MKHACLFFLLSTSMSLTNANASESPLDDVNLDFRYRVESVKQSGISKDALASSLKSRLNYLTSSYKGTQLFLELDNVTYLGDDNFNNTRNGKTRYPVVADPSGTGFNQAYLRRTGTNYIATLGRQRILHDGQRFIGGVAWRQNEQTYDGLRIEINPKAKLSGSWAYLSRVSRIFGPENGAPTDSFDSNSHLARLQYDAGAAGILTGYGYFLDLEDAPALSNRTVGLRYQNTLTPGKANIPIRIEYAHQNDYGDNPLGLSVNYIAIDVSLKTELATFSVGNERLEGSSSGGFETPLATLHKYQGWTDKFLTTPKAGIDDRYASVAGKTRSVKWTLAYHKFHAERSSARYGSEIGLSLGVNLTKQIVATFKWARYRADTFSTDATKAWLMLSASL